MFCVFTIELVYNELKVAFSAPIRLLAHYTISNFMIIRSDVYITVGTNVLI